MLDIRWGNSTNYYLEGRYKKGVIYPLSKAEKQGLAPQDIVPLKLVAKNQIQKAGQEPEIQNRGPKTTEILKY